MSLNPFRAADKNSGAEASTEETFCMTQHQTLKEFIIDKAQIRAKSQPDLNKAMQGKARKFTECIRTPF